MLWSGLVGVLASGAQRAAHVPPLPLSSCALGLGPIPATHTRFCSIFSNSEIPCGTSTHILDKWGKMLIEGADCYLFHIVCS